MGWFSSGGRTAELAELDAATTQARTWLSTVSTAGGWPAAMVATVEAFIVQESGEADGWFSDDVPAFYAGLVESMDATEAAGVAVPARWGKLRDSYATAAGAATRNAAELTTGDVSTVLGGTVTRSVEDVAEVTQAAAKVAETGVSLFKRPTTWALLALLGVGYLASRRS